MAHIRQARPDSGLGFQLNFLSKLVPLRLEAVAGSTAWQPPWQPLAHDVDQIDPFLKVTPLTKAVNLTGNRFKYCRNDRRTVQKRIDLTYSRVATGWQPPGPLQAHSIDQIDPLLKVTPPTKDWNPVKNAVGIIEGPLKNGWV